MKTSMFGAISDETFDVRCDYQQTLRYSGMCIVSM